MPLPWKKSNSSRISRFVSDFQQSPKHAGSLVVETGFPTSLIDLFVKNRDRLKRPSSRSSFRAPTQIASNPSRRRVSSLPPRKVDSEPVTEEPSVSMVEESLVFGSTAENKHDGEEDRERRGGRRCVLMVVVFKVFVVVLLALSTKKLAVGITLSAFVLLFLELAVARVFTLLKLYPEVQIRLDSFITKLVGKRRQEKLEESSSAKDRRNKVSFEIIEEFSDEIRVPQSNLEVSSTLEKKREVQTIRDVVFNIEKSKRSKLKSKIAKKLRSYKKKKMPITQKEEESVTEEPIFFSDEIIESEISEKDDVVSNPPLLESSEEIENEEVGSKGDLTKVMILIVIVLTGLLNGKVLAACLTLSYCLSLRLICCKSQTSL